MNILKSTLLILIILSSFGSFAEKPKNQSSASDKIQTVFLGGGCFWGVQNLLRNYKGVTHTEVGYMGDSGTKVSYDLVKKGNTNFAETVKVDFDSTVTNLESVLKYFFKIHDPTTLNQQGNDIGKQYRSVIFYSNSEQQKIAQDLIGKIQKKKIFKSKITTQITASGNWYKAENFHQDYLVKNPDGYTCHFERDLKF